MDFDKASFGSRLRILMQEKGDTLYTVAAYLGMKPSTISRYVNGHYAPKAHVLERLAQYYQVNPAWLLGTESVRRNTEHASSRVPILGDVAAGVPIWAEQNFDGYAAVDADERIDFALRVRGDSMINARIYTGDLVYVRRQPEVENGEIAVVLVDGEATVKRVWNREDSILLHPENPAYSDMVFPKDNSHSLAVLGKVIFVKGRVE